MLRSPETMGPEVPSLMLGPPSPSWMELSVGSPPGPSKTDHSCLANQLADPLPVEENTPARSGEVQSELEPATVYRPTAQRSLLKRSQVPTSNVLIATPKKTKLKRSRSYARSAVQKQAKRLIRSTADPILKSIVEPIEEPLATNLLSWDDELIVTEVSAESGNMRTVLPPGCTPPPPAREDMDTAAFMNEFWGDLLDGFSPMNSDSELDVVPPQPAAGTGIMVSTPATPGLLSAHTPAQPPATRVQSRSNGAQLEMDAALAATATAQIVNVNTAAVEETTQLNLAELMNGITDDELMELSTFLDLEPEKAAQADILEDPKCGISSGEDAHSQLLSAPEATATTIDLGALLQDSDIVFNDSLPSHTATSSTSAEVSDVSSVASRHLSSQSIATSTVSTWSTSNETCQRLSESSNTCSRDRHESEQSFVSVSSTKSRHISGQSCTPLTGQVRHVSGQSFTPIPSPQSRHVSGNWEDISPPDSVASSATEQQPTHYILFVPATDDSVSEVSDLISQDERVTDTDTVFATPATSSRGRKAARTTTTKHRATKRSLDESPSPAPSPAKRRPRAPPDETISPAEKYRRIRDCNNLASRRSRLNRKQREQGMTERLDELEEENVLLKERAETLERLLGEVKALVPLLTAKKQ